VSAVTEPIHTYPATLPITPITPTRIADAGVRALRAEARLTPKPGLVDERGGASHPDMSVALLLASADELREPLRQCAEAALAMPLGSELRAHLGRIGRAGERLMLDVTAGVNTHRGALWALGLLSAGVAVTGDAESAARFAAKLARIPDPCAPAPATPSHGQRARLQCGTRGAVGEASDGFPHVVRVALPAMRVSRHRCESTESTALNALISIMATLDDTCVVHRGGTLGLRMVHRRAADIMRAGGCGTSEGRRRLEAFCAEADDRGLSMGGSADLLAAALFLDLLAQPEGV
jgi:triphosphoribosyl-dephospho-CoA synthase